MFPSLTSTCTVLLCCFDKCSEAQVAKIKKVGGQTFCELCNAQCKCNKKHRAAACSDEERKNDDFDVV